MNKEHHKNIKLQNLRATVIVWTVLMMFMILSFLALVVDLGHLYIVHNELQNAADSAALNGANYLYPASSGTPNWTTAETKATNSVTLNIADGASLTDSTVTPGYWNITGTPSSLESTSITPGHYDLPAIQVTVAKDTGLNGGQVSLFFGPIIGIKTVAVSATAVAVVGGAASVGAGKLYPIALSETAYNTYWNSSTNEPLINPLTGSAFDILVCGIFSIYGTWTTFNTSNSNSQTILNFIQNGSPIAYNIGNSIWIAPGAQTGLSNSISVGSKVVLPIVSNVTSSGLQSIVAFGAAQIDAVYGLLGTYLSIHLISNQLEYDVDPGGPNYGVYTTSRLAY